jgi:hypothetical protein
MDAIGCRAPFVREADAGRDARIAAVVTASENEAVRKRTIRHLRQLIDALNRRVPHIERVGEAQIARDAAELMKQALKRLKALEKSD